MSAENQLNYLKIIIKINSIQKGLKTKICEIREPYFVFGSVQKINTPNILPLFQKEISNEK